MTLRQRVIQLMERVHLIPSGLAEYHVREMDDEEVFRRMRIVRQVGS